MSNRAYLAVSDIERIYPGFQNETFDQRESWVLASAGCVPLLWLPLFTEGDLAAATFQDRHGPIEALAPLAELKAALARLRLRAPTLNRWFAASGGVAHHAELLLDYLGQQTGKYVTLQVDEIECLYAEGQFNELLRGCLRLLDAADSEAKDYLIELSTVMPERRFITLAEANEGTYDQEDQWNFFRILGEGYLKAPPWT